MANYAMPGSAMLSSYIAVFDSGIGGLTVLSVLRHTYPNRSFLYLGDTARVPYGTKSPEVVTQYALESAWFLSRFPLDAIVVACNTVSAVAMPALHATYPDIPIFGVVGPGARAAVEATRSKQIAVLGTEGTIASGAYRKAVHANDPEIEVTGIACPLFVPLVEEGILSGQIAKLAVEHYLAGKIAKEIDTVVLGCTHYPLLREVIQEVVGPQIKIVDSAAPLAQELSAHLPAAPRGEARLRIFTTDSPERFMRIGARFLGSAVVEPTRINLEEMIYAKRLVGGEDMA
jgi:glutamate racemase